MNYKVVWCAACAVDLGVPLESERGDAVAARWGYVGVPFLACDYCRGRLIKGQTAVAISVYDKPSDYEPWEGELLTGLDSDEGDEARKRRGSA
jgi:hypothetical protein